MLKALFIDDMTVLSDPEKTFNGGGRSQFCIKSKPELGESKRPNNKSFSFKALEFIFWLFDAGHPAIF
jgi:hypothetical protein